MSNENFRFKLLDFEISGTIHDIDNLIPYSSGDGFLRNVVIETKSKVVGIEDPVYLPVTVFGTDATGLDASADIGRPISCTGRLYSRRYVDGTGNKRWSLSVTARAVILGDRKPESERADPDSAAALADTVKDQDEDLPF